MTAVLLVRLGAARDWDTAVADLARRVDGASLVLLADGAARLIVDATQRAAIEPWASKHGIDVERAEVARRVLPAPGPHAPASERGALFVERARASQTVWGLYGTTWARSDAGGDAEALPFWPSREAAAACVGARWADHVPRSIALDAFLEQWLVGMIEDGIVAVVWPTPSDDGVVEDPARLAGALLEGS